MRRSVAFLAFGVILVVFLCDLLIILHALEQTESEGFVPIVKDHHKPRWLDQQEVTLSKQDKQYALAVATSLWPKHTTCKNPVQSLGSSCVMASVVEETEDLTMIKLEDESLAQLVLIHFKGNHSPSL